MKHFDLGEQDILTCECCMKQGRVDGEGFDFHHIWGRGKDKDVIQNIMCLCRNCHLKAQNEISKESMQLIHNYFLTGQRKTFLK
jgi:hypothetical protein